MEKIKSLDSEKVKSNLIKLYNLLVRANNMIPDYGPHRKTNERMIDSNCNRMQLITTILYDDNPDFKKYIAIGHEERNVFFEKYSDLFPKVQTNV
jgi:hypothetical protein